MHAEQVKPLTRVPYLAIRPARQTSCQMLHHPEKVFWSGLVPHYTELTLLRKGESSCRNILAGVRIARTFVIWTGVAVRRMAKEKTPGLSGGLPHAERLPAQYPALVVSIRTGPSDRRRHSDRPAGCQWPGWRSATRRSYRWVRCSQRWPRRSGRYSASSPCRRG